MIKVQQETFAVPTVSVNVSVDVSVDVNSNINLYSAETSESQCAQCSIGLYRE